MSSPSPARVLPWVGLLALASGAPYALVNTTAPTLLKAQGVTNTQLGWLQLIAFAWVLKFAVAPAVDRFGSRRSWAVACQAAIALALLWIATLPPDRVPPQTWIALSALALLSATQDLAVDAYAVEAVPARWLGPANGLRQSLYKIAVVLAGGTLVARSPSLGWAGTWQVAAGVFAALALITAWLPPAPKQPPVGTPLVEPVRRLLARDGAVGFLLFVLLFKVGDRAMAPSTTPFLMDSGFSLGTIGDVVTPLVVVATILGAMLGGALTHRWGAFKALWILGAAQALSNLGYAAAAATGSVPLAWAALLIEPFCGGLGTAPFVTVLMLSCERGHVATQFALLTALMGLVGGSVAVGWGRLTDAVGYAPWFALTFVLSLPAFLLLPYVRRWLAVEVARPSSAPPAECSDTSTP